MKKFEKYVLFGIVTLLGSAIVSFGLTPIRLGLEDSALYGATHLVKFTYEDFDETTTNTADSFNVPIGANTAVSVSLFKLNTAFDTANTNYTGSLALTVGDASDVDRFLTSTELASDGTEVRLKVGNTVWNSGTASNVTLSLGRVVYTGTTNVVLTFTPNSEEATASNASGVGSLYLNIIPFAQ